VFKKIKPKQLHGRLLTGTMFIELCQAYTESINKGSVPNIENAWVSLCKNENMRAIQIAISSYEREMEKGIYLDGSNKKECIEYNELKQLHKEVTQKIFEQFKEKAIGD
jgi:hypothetical protein